MVRSPAVRGVPALPDGLFLITSPVPLLLVQRPNADGEIVARVGFAVGPAAATAGDNVFAVWGEIEPPAGTHVSVVPGDFLARFQIPDAHFATERSGHSLFPVCRN